MKTVFDDETLQELEDWVRGWIWSLETFPHKRVESEGDLENFKRVKEVINNQQQLIETLRTTYMDGHKKTNGLQDAPNKNHLYDRGRMMACVDIAIRQGINSQELKKEGMIESPEESASQG